MYIVSSNITVNSNIIQILHINSLAFKNGVMVDVSKLIIYYAKPLNISIKQQQHP
jgi:hypothetical protein